MAADISLAKRTLLNNPGKRVPMSKSGKDTTALCYLCNEIITHFSIETQLQLSVLDCTVWDPDKMHE